MLLSQHLGTNKSFGKNKVNEKSKPKDNKSIKANRKVVNLSQADISKFKK